LGCERCPETAVNDVVNSDTFGRALYQPQCAELWSVASNFLTNCHNSCQSLRAFGQASGCECTYVRIVKEM
jgi:hypothetical protein